MSCTRSSPFLTDDFFSAPTAPEQVCPSTYAGGVNPSPHLPLSQPRLLVFPDCCPHVVLWTWDNCKNNPDVGASIGNVSWPPMQHAIQDKKEEMITNAQWKLIHQFATIITRTHLEILKTSSLLSHGQPRKKKFYKCFFLREWLQALKDLEAATPLLSLCFNTWKADLTLGSVLQDEHSEPSHLATPSHHSHLAPPSCVLTPSSLAHTPGLARTPSSLAPASRVLPASRSSTPSSIAPASHTSQPSPCRTLFKSSTLTQPCAPSRVVQPLPPEPRPAGKVTVMNRDHGP
jgi:hypothetical protein